MRIEMYADGSSSPVKSKEKWCGWAFALVINDELVYSNSGNIAYGTNNEAELTACIKALEYVEHNYTAKYITDMLLISDSQLALGYANGQFRCRKKHLKPYHDRLAVLYKAMGFGTQWVKGHSGNKWNELCDRMANDARLLVCKDNVRQVSKKFTRGTSPIP